MLYHLDESAEPGVTVIRDGDERETLPGLALPPEIARQLFRRSGRVRQIEVSLTRRQLLDG